MSTVNGAPSSSCLPAGGGARHPRHGDYKMVCARSTCLDIHRAIPQAINYPLDVNFYS
jgi:hypothetical protein